MKKRVFLTGLIAALLLFIFSGCESEPKSLRICVDVWTYFEDVERDLEKAMNEFVELVQEKGGPQNIEVEFVPAHGTERETEMDRIRTEIMSGGGPDIFLVYTGRSDELYFYDLQALFPITEKSMELGVFLPLDEYIDKAQFMEWDSMTQAIMDVGRTEEGQQVIPLTYTLPVTFYRQSDASDTPSANTTWMDMMEDESRVLTNAAFWGFQKNANGTDFEASPDKLEYSLGALADYKEEELLFTEAELLERLTELYALDDLYAEGALDDVPPSYKRRMYVGYNNGELSRGQDMRNGLLRDDVLTMVPIYSDDGGVTASVEAYTCINRNTEYPEDAFFVVDLLLSREMQQNSALYDLLYFSMGSSGLPVYDDLMQEDYPIYTRWTMNQWYMSEENFAEFCEIREQITHAQIPNTLSARLSEVYWEWLEVKHGNTEGDLEQFVSDTYRAMNQILGE